MCPTACTVALPPNTLERAIAKLPAVPTVKQNRLRIQTAAEVLLEGRNMRFWLIADASEVHSRTFCILLVILSVSRRVLQLRLAYLKELMNFWR